MGSDAFGYEFLYPGTVGWTWGKLQCIAYG